MQDAATKAAFALLASLGNDDAGINGRGGNGGLISRETIRKADDLRIALLTEATLRGGPQPAIQATETV